MGATEIGLIERLLAIAISPTGGAFFLGVLLGLGLAWWFIHKHILPAKLKAAEALCTAKIEALNERLNRVEPIAKKWERFMERTAFERLGKPKDDLDSTLP
jgi:hypothetical protein